MTPFMVKDQGQNRAGMDSFVDKSGVFCGRSTNCRRIWCGDSSDKPQRETSDRRRLT